MKTDFSQPRFTGARFDDHTLPVDVARDLAAYETLIVELAKHLWLEDNHDKQRVPKGFASSFRLDIERIDEGSTRPLLSLVLAGVLELTGGEQDCFARSRDLIAECIASPDGALPAQFPKELLVHFNRFGRSLREDEALELPVRGGNNVARLTQNRRKELVLAADQVYQKDISLNGYIEEVDFAKPTFRLKLFDGGTAIVPMPDFFQNNARTYVGRPRHQINLIGVGTFDSWDRLQKVVSVDSLDVTSNYAISARFDEISQLQDGWFEGIGLAPNANNLAAVSEKLIGHYPEKLLLPQITPTQEGNLLLEWKAEGYPSLDIDLGTAQASFHAFSRDGGDIERDFNLDNAGWSALFAFLVTQIKVRQA